jgi:pimeloyl-ACP methyl ester carboxylesterase
MFGGVLPIEPLYDDPVVARLLDGLRELGRVVVFDRRGVGLSGSVTDWSASLDELWVTDLLAVIEAAALHAPVVIAGGANAGPVAAIAATETDVIDSVVLYEPYIPSEWDEQASERVSEVSCREIPTSVRSWRCCADDHPRSFCSDRAGC